MAAVTPPSKQRQAILLDGEPLDKFDQFLNSVIIAKDQGTEEIKSKIDLARFAFSHLQSWLRRGISLPTKGRVYRAVVRSIVLYGCET